MEHGANLRPNYVDSDAPYEAARSQDSSHGGEDFGLDDETRTMLIDVRQKAKKALNNIAQKYNSSPPADTFGIGGFVSLHINARLAIIDVSIILFIHWHLFIF